MTTTIRPYEDADGDAVVELSLRAWAPVFASIHGVLGKRLFTHFYGPDWRDAQAADVRRACRAYDVLVADDDARVVGFTAIDLPPGTEEGEIYMVAVDPVAQNRGIGTLLTEAAVERMRAAGKRMAVVETGSNPGHAPARATYEKAGFVAWPSHKFYRLLDE